MKRIRPRFTRALIRETLERQIEYLETAHSFTRDNGWAQVEGKGEEVNRAYGAYSSYQWMLEEFGQ